MSIVAWIVLGLIAGFIGNKLVKRTGKWLVRDILLGIVGAMSGGHLSKTFWGTGYDRPVHL